MPTWNNNPQIFEINTRVWLTALSRQYGRTIQLHTVPEAVLDDLASYGFDGIWLMGVWQHSPAARRSALNYTHEYRPALPDMTNEDVSGSPYAVYQYTVDRDFGGRRALERIRERFAARGLCLMLDYVPNHMAVDTPLLRSNPGYFVQGYKRDFYNDDFMFFLMEDVWGRTYYPARGRDPYFMPWIDTAQLNAYNPDLRLPTAETLLDIAEQCDGVRCDMAMLMTNGVFQQTWGYYVSEPPDTEFWPDIIPLVKDHYPDFLFTAEVYWDMEYTLQQQGFDYTYDKRLYDRLLEGDAAAIRAHLSADLRYQQKMVRFLENHDEPRAQDTLGDRQPAAAVLTFSLPGASLFFDGQFTGSLVKLPVQLGRAPDEPRNEGLHAFYRKLIAELSAPLYRNGLWHLLEIGPADGSNGSEANLVAHGWHDPASGEYRLVIANVTSHWSQGMVRLHRWPMLAGHEWQLHDVIRESVYTQEGNSLISDGLYVELGPHGFHLFEFDEVQPPPFVQPDTSRQAIDETVEAEAVVLSDDTMEHEVIPAPVERRRKGRRKKK